jgi:hypothetical protein
MRRLICLLLGVALLIGIMPLPYNYYIFIRFFTFIVCMINLYAFFIDNENGRATHLLLILFMISALVLWNPFMPFHLTKVIWSTLDGVYGLSFVLYGMFIDKLMQIQKK